jgi:hypothetical protein
MNIRRAAFWTLLILFAALLFWWATFIPYRPDRLYSAIPHTAVWVGEQARLAQRWPELAAHPLVRHGAALAGVSSEEWEKFAADPALSRWRARLAGRSTVCAYVPALGNQREPAWICASWIGGYSQRLRWQTAFLRNTEFRPIRLERGRTIWLVTPKATRFPRERFLSLALAEGMLLGCYSRDPAGVRFVLEQCESEAGSVNVIAAGTLRRAEALWGHPAADRGWFFLPPQEAASLPRLVAYRLDLTDRRAARCTFATESPWRGLSQPCAPGAAQTLAGVWDGAPVIVAHASWDFWASLLASVLSQKQLADLSKFIEGAGEIQSPQVAIGLLRDEYSGRIRSLFKGLLGAIARGLKVPTLIVAVETGAHPLQMYRHIKDALDILNSRHGWGLIPHEMPTESQSIMTVEETSANNAYRRFEADERIGYVCVSNWLILASNAGALRKIMNQPVRGAAPNDAGPAPAAPWIAAGATAGGWCEAQPASGIIQNALSVATLLFAFQAPQTATGIRSAMEEFRRALAILAPIQTVTLRAEPPQAGAIRISLELSVEPPASGAVTNGIAGGGGG